MGSKIFVSYSSPDQAKADLIRQALEGAGMSCWIAPRDLHPGTQWGAGIVQAIHACDAVVVVFSQAANGSPQVAREMELSVASRKPLIPIRVANDMPTDDMQYFLGVSHWFNAYNQPLESYLPDIVAAVAGVLKRQQSPWANISRRMPKSRNAQILWAVAAAAVAALTVGLLQRPANPYRAMESPMAGRWSAKITPPGGGAPVNCVLDVPKGGAATFSDTCPDPLTGAAGPLNAAPFSTYAPDQYKSGDSGTFMFQGMSGGGFTAAYHLGFFGGLKTRDARFGEINWRRVAGDKPLSSAATEILPAGSSWPVSGVPALVDRATQYVRSHWKSDATLMELALKPGGATGVDATFTYYSPDAQQVRTLMPSLPGGGLTPPSARQENLSEAVSPGFIDLPDAIARAHQVGVQGKDIAAADLQWSGGDSCGTGIFRIDNAILPKCRPGRFIGLQWRIESALGEHVYVPARP